MCVFPDRRCTTTGWTTCTWITDWLCPSTPAPSWSSHSRTSGLQSTLYGKFLLGRCNRQWKELTQGCTDKYTQSYHQGIQMFELVFARFLKQLPIFFFVDLLHTSFLEFWSTRHFLMRELFSLFKTSLTDAVLTKNVFTGPFCVNMQTCPACRLRPWSTGRKRHVHGAVLSPLHHLPPARTREGHPGGPGK